MSIFELAVQIGLEIAADHLPDTIEEEVIHKPYRIWMSSGSWEEQFEYPDLVKALAGLIQLQLSAFTWREMDGIVRSFRIEICE